eukprot:2518898-Rhodomonas_salina.1
MLSPALAARRARVRVGHRKAAARADTRGSLGAVHALDHRQIRHAGYLAMRSRFRDFALACLCESARRGFCERSFGCDRCAEIWGAGGGRINSRKLRGLNRAPAFWPCCSGASR